MTSTPTAQPVATRRDAVTQALNDVRAIAGQQPDRAALAAIAQRLQALAACAELFARDVFPPPGASEGVGASTRYRLNPEDDDEGIALYLNSINPGKTTIPHNHDTWAVIVAVDGQEQNRVYRRTDDGSDPKHAKLELARELTVEPGRSIEFLPEDLHSIHVVGDRPTLHLHCYGRALERLSGRYGVQPETGEIVNYNATQMKPSKVATA